MFDLIVVMNTRTKYCASPSLSHNIGWLVIYDGCMWTFGMVSNLLILHASPSANVAMHDFSIALCPSLLSFFLVGVIALYDTDIVHCLNS